MNAGATQYKVPADGIPDYPWIPEDAIRLTTYEEVAEMLRSPALVTEPRIVDAPFKQGVLNNLNGKEHLQRRRAMNRLFRSDAVDFYRANVFRPALLEQMRTVATHPDPDGIHRGDVVNMATSSFVPVLATMAGVAVPQRDGLARLLELFAAMRRGADGRYEQGDITDIMRRGLDAKKEFTASHYEPAAAKCPVAHGADLDSGRKTLIELMAARVDPHWEDDGLRLRETIAIMLQFTGTVTEITSAVDELSLWLETHPLDRARIADAEFLGRVMMEAIRFRPLGPFARIAIDDVVLGTGRRIERGRYVIASRILANRDETVFGPDAASFNPHRTLPAGVPRYGLGFGAGPHQCIGLGLVMGATGVGVGTDALEVFFRAGVEPDRARTPRLVDNLKHTFAQYPAIFRHPASALAASG